MWLVALCVVVAGVRMRSDGRVRHDRYMEDVKSELVQTQCIKLDAHDHRERLYVLLPSFYRWPSANSIISTAVYRCFP